MPLCDLELIGAQTSYQKQKNAEKKKKLVRPVDSTVEVRKGPAVERKLSAKKEK